MNALDDFRWKVKHALEQQEWVVLTGAEGQAVLDDIDGKPPAIETRAPTPRPQAPARAVVGSDVVLDDEVI